MKVSAVSDRGKVRPSNQDSYLLEETDKGMLCILADGMGGYAGGEIASKMAVDLIFQGVAEATEEVNEETLLDILTRANDAIYRKSIVEPGLTGMGTTLCVALIMRERTILAHVGDSRIYLWHDKELRQLTKDHTLVAELIRSGEITAEQALTHPHRHILTRAFGVEYNTQLDMETIQLNEGDRLLMCSDGLYMYVTDEEIRRLLVRRPSVKKVCDRLLEKAMKGGGADNITVLCVEKEGEA